MDAASDTGHKILSGKQPEPDPLIIQNNLARYDVSEFTFDEQRAMCFFTKIHHLIPIHHHRYQVAVQVIVELTQ